MSIATSTPSAASTTYSRPLVDAWVLFGLGVAIVVAGLAFAFGLLLSRRSSPPRLVVPDTIEELEPDSSPLSRV